MSIISKNFRNAVLAISLAGLVALSGCESEDGSRASSSSNSTPQDNSSNSITTGTVDGFGSVMVNGIHFNTDGAAFSIEEKEGNQSDLSVGQVVEIIGSASNGEGKAISISYEQNLQGPVNSVDINAERFVALGQTILVDSLTIFENTSLDSLTVGEYVEISGVNDAEGNIRASYVGSRNKDDEYIELRGTLSNLNLDARTFNINSQTISYSDSTKLDFDGSIQNGMVVDVEGELSGSTLVATKIESEDDEHIEGDELEIEGFVTALSVELSQFDMTGITIQYSDNTEFKHGTVSNIALNAALEVEGTINTAGVLEASEIKFEDTVSMKFEGQVQEVDTINNKLTVLDMVFTIDTNTRIRDKRDKIQMFSLSNISIGDHVKIKAFKDATDQYVAAKLERTEIETETEIELEASIGRIDLDAQIISLLGITVDLSHPALEIEHMTIAEFFNTVTVGDVVEIKGLYEEGIFVAFEIELEEKKTEEDDDDDDDDDDDADDADDDKE